MAESSVSLLLALLVFCMSSGWQKRAGYLNNFSAPGSKRFFAAAAASSISIGGDQTLYSVSPRVDRQRDPFDARRKPKPISNVTVYLHPGRLGLATNDTDTSNVSAIHWVFSPGQTAQDIPLDQLECTCVKLILIFGNV